jgi:glycosyltransferase involved in cell wall biosynthesis
MSAAEAAACGRPTLAAAAGGITEVVSDGETGFLVPPGDVDGLSSAITRVAADAELCANLGDRALDRARTRFDVDTMMSAIHAFCSDVVSARASEPLKRGAWAVQSRLQRTDIQPTPVA